MIRNIFNLLRTEINIHDNLVYIHYCIFAAIITAWSLVVIYYLDIDICLKTIGDGVHKLSWYI